MTSQEKLFAQMWGWELPELKGQVLTKVYAFTFHSDNSHPEKVFMELESGEVHSFFMSAGGCWRQLDDDDVIFEHETYEDAQVVDYTECFGLRGQSIQCVSCGDQMPMTVQILLSGGLLRLIEADWNDLECDNTLEYVPGKSNFIGAT